MRFRGLKALNDNLGKLGLRLPPQILRQRTCLIIGGRCVGKRPDKHSAFRLTGMYIRLEVG